MPRRRGLVPDGEQEHLDDDQDHRDREVDPQGGHADFAPET
jgi:hypothetical protein